MAKKQEVWCTSTY